MLHLFSTKNEITESGASSLLYLYKVDKTNGLDRVRVNKFVEKVAKNACSVDPKELPQTSGAAKYHILCVYLQIQEWKGDDEDLDPTDWGWKSVGAALKPSTTDKPPDPDYLMRVVRCMCKKGSQPKVEAAEN
jgi:hypothetical protein